MRSDTSKLLLKRLDIEDDGPSCLTTGIYTKGTRPSFRDDDDVTLSGDGASERLPVFLFFPYVFFGGFVFLFFFLMDRPGGQREFADGTRREIRRGGRQEKKRRRRSRRKNMLRSRCDLA